MKALDSTSLAATTAKIGLPSGNQAAIDSCHTALSLSHFVLSMFELPNSEGGELKSMWAL